MARNNNQALDELAARIYVDSEDANGIVDESWASQQLAEAIRQDPSVLNPDTIASAAIKRQHEARTPRLHQNGSRQLTLFDPEGYLPIGEGITVRHTRVTEEQWDQYWLVQEQQVKAQLAAHEEKAEIYRSRKAVWRPGELWPEVEARF